MLITRSMLSALSLEAATSPRRRKNRNFHLDNSAPAHRLLNALEPDSYVRPHRHLDADKDETIVALQGRFGVILFDGAGKVTERAVISPGGQCMGIDIAHGTFHSILALEPGSVFFEAKAGPYVPITAAELADWAPAEDDRASVEYLNVMRVMFA